MLKTHETLVCSVVFVNLDNLVLMRLWSQNMLSGRKQTFGSVCLISTKPPPICNTYNSPPKGGRRLR